MSGEQVRPEYYGGPDNVYEARKVIKAWGLNFNLGTAAKYLSRAGKKPGADPIEDLRKAATYITFEIEERLVEQQQPEPAQIADRIEKGT